MLPTGDMMSRPTRKYNIRKTDLRPPGQRLVADGRLISPQDLFHSQTDAAHPPAANADTRIAVIDRSNSKLKGSKKGAVAAKPKPTSGGDANSNPKFTMGIFDRAGFGLTKRARELIMRIGRPRQP